MFENKPIFEIDSKDCKIVTLSGGNSDGVTTVVHQQAEYTDRPQGRYEFLKTLNGCTVFKIAQTLRGL